MQRKQRQLSTQSTLSLLLSGKGHAAKKYAGKHVLVVRNTVHPLRAGEEGRRSWKKLKERYREAPIVVFVPRQDVSYILESMQLCFKKHISVFSY